MNIPSFAIDNDQHQGQILVLVNENSDQVNTLESPKHNQEIVLEEQSQQPYEKMSLRRSTRERKNAIPIEFTIFLQEHGDDIELIEEDLINFH